MFIQEIIVIVCGLWFLQTLSVCVCLSVFPAFTVYILPDMGRILIKLGENVGTSVQLFVDNFMKIGLILT